MASKRHKSEETLQKLRQPEVLMAKAGRWWRPAGRLG
jgi:hypothetical protein